MNRDEIVGMLAVGALALFICVLVIAAVVRG